MAFTVGMYSTDLLDRFRQEAYSQTEALLHKNIWVLTVGWEKPLTKPDRTQLVHVYHGGKQGDGEREGMDNLVTRLMSLT